MQNDIPIIPMPNLEIKKKRRRTKKTISNIIRYLILSIYAVMCLYPIYFSIVSSLKKSNEIFINPFGLPKVAQFENYSRAWVIGNIGTYFKNSVVLTFGTLVIAAILGTLASYILARFDFKFKNFIYLFFTLGLMIPSQSTIIPLSFNLGALHLTNNFFILIMLLVAFNMSMTIFILTGFMKGLPRELEEAACMDGCSPFFIYLKIILPLSMPGIVTSAIFNFIHTWNNLLFPLVFISDNNLKTLSIGLMTFFAQYTSDYGAVMAAIAISIIPTILTYFISQEKVEKGLTAGAVKG